MQCMTILLEYSISRNSFQLTVTSKAAVLGLNIFSNSIIAFGFPLPR
jgi:hypothetical protein